MNCTLCKKEIELNLEYQMRNDHAYHEGCATTYDKDEKVNSFHANGCWFSMIRPLCHYVLGNGYCNAEKIDDDLYCSKHKK